VPAIFLSAPERNARAVHLKEETLMEFWQVLHAGGVLALVATIAWMAARIGGAVGYDRYAPPRAHFR
jgi:hypothetical protein